MDAEDSVFRGKPFAKHLFSFSAVFLVFGKIFVVPLSLNLESFKVGTSDLELLRSLRS